MSAGPTRSIVHANQVESALWITKVAQRCPEFMQKLHVVAPAFWSQISANFLLRRVSMLPAWRPSRHYQHEWMLLTFPDSHHVVRDSFLNIPHYLSGSWKSSHQISVNVLLSLDALLHTIHKTLKLKQAMLRTASLLCCGMPVLIRNEQTVCIDRTEHGALMPSEHRRKVCEEVGWWLLWPIHEACTVTRTYFLTNRSQDLSKAAVALKPPGPTPPHNKHVAVPPEFHFS